MVFLITPANRHRYASELDAIFRLRHDVLIEALGWKGLHSTNGREIDEFDDQRALYLGIRDTMGSNDVIGCMRLNPMNGPNLTTRHFSHLVEFDDLPTSVHAFDVTRHLISPRHEQSLKESLAGLDLFCALYEFGLMEVASEFVAVIPIHLFSVLMQIGVEIDALGFPVEIEGETCLAARGPASEKSLQALYRATRNTAPRLTASANEILLRMAV